MCQNRFHSAFRIATTAWISILVVVLACPVKAQDRSSLESQRANLLRQIETNTKLLSEAQNKQKTTVGEIERLKAEVKLRRKVVSTYQQEIRLLTGSLASKEENLARLRNETRELASRHASHLRSAYLEQKMEVRILYLLSAVNINEAFARWRYLYAVSQMRENTFKQLTSHQDSIIKEVAAIQALRADKQRVAEQTLDQEKELSGTVKKSEEVLQKLKSREKEIVAQLDRQKRERARLDAEIERIIKADVAKTSGDAGLPMAPELKVLTEQFAGNKGKLPWPVDRGIITGYFGEQPHPVVPSIKIINNGIDITTPGGSSVHAIFGGKVVGVKTIPGYDYTVIVQHGSYYSVYSRLTEIFVELNDTVKTGESIGKLPKPEAENPKLHLEIWQNKTQVDPEVWITH